MACVIVHAAHLEPPAADGGAQAVEHGLEQVDDVAARAMAVRQPRALEQQVGHEPRDHVPPHAHDVEPFRRHRLEREQRGVARGPPGEVAVRRAGRGDEVPAAHDPVLDLVVHRLLEHALRGEEQHLELGQRLGVQLAHVDDLRVDARAQEQRVQPAVGEEREVAVRIEQVRFVEVVVGGEAKVREVHAEADRVVDLRHAQQVVAPALEELADARDDRVARGGLAVLVERGAEVVRLAGRLAPVVHGEQAQSARRVRERAEHRLHDDSVADPRARIEPAGAELRGQRRALGRLVGREDARVERGDEREVRGEAARPTPSGTRRSRCSQCVPARAARAAGCAACPARCARAARARRTSFAVWASHSR